MHRRIRLLAIALFLTSLPGLSATSSLQKLRNDKVSVTEDRLAPGHAASFPAARPNVIIYLSGSAIEIFSSAGKGAHEIVRRGETAFEPAGTKSLKNTGSSELKYVRIEFLTPGKQETWSKTGLPPNYKILLDNRYARAYDIRIAPHTYEQRHTHHDRVVICLSGAVLEHLLPDGKKQPSSLKTGEIVWRPGATHVGHNMGLTELWVICVEPK